MRPEDDPTWPECSIHNTRHWCSFIRDNFLAGDDAGFMDPGLRYSVPIVPSLELFAGVSISSEAVVPDIAWSIDLVRPDDPDDPFGVQEDLVPLGLWSRDEGRLVIASSINDWVGSKDVDTCQHHRHGFAEEMKFQDASKTPNERKANRWCIAYYGMCKHCVDSGNNARVPASHSFNASSYGLGDSSFGKASRPPASARQNRARDALKERYGK